MAIAQGQCTIFKVNCLSGLENFASGTPYTYKIALYTGLANLGPTTTAYTTANEISGTGYTAGGLPLVISQTPTSGTSTTAYLSFQNAVWTGANFTARCALIYNSNTGAAVCVLDFGSDKVTTPAGSFTVVFPQATADTAILRIS